MIAAENDFTPLEEKRATGERLGAGFVVVRGSRHGTPFDAVRATNASLLALLDGSGRCRPSRALDADDAEPLGHELPFVGSVAEEHAVRRSEHCGWRGTRGLV